MKRNQSKDEVVGNVILQLEDLHGKLEYWFGHFRTDQIKEHTKEKLMESIHELRSIHPEFEHEYL